jgi:hypothetical protein
MTRPSPKGKPACRSSAIQTTAPPCVADTGSRANQYGHASYYYDEPDQPDYDEADDPDWTGYGYDQEDDLADDDDLADLGQVRTLAEVLDEWWELHAHRFAGPARPDGTTNERR